MARASPSARQHGRLPPITPRKLNAAPVPPVEKARRITPWWSRVRYPAWSIRPRGRPMHCAMERPRCWFRICAWSRRSSALSVRSGGCPARVSPALRRCRRAIRARLAPPIPTLALALGHGAPLRPPRLWPFFQDAGIAMGAATLAGWRSDPSGIWRDATVAIQQAGRARRDGQATDQTATRVAGQNETGHVRGTPVGTVEHPRPAAPVRRCWRCGGARNRVFACMPLHGPGGRPAASAAR